MGDVEVKALLDGHGLDHYRAHCRFALSESYLARPADDAAMQRERRRTQVLRSRGSPGLNRN